MNCIVIDDDKLSRKVIESYINRTDFLNLHSSYSNAINAINQIHKNEPIDLIFLDIEMPEMTGMEFLKSLINPPQIIITSSKEHYAFEAFEFNVTDYLLKPISYSRFYKAARKALDRHRHSASFLQNKHEIFIKTNASIIRLNYDDILWIKAMENYVVLHTYNSKYTIHFTMKAIEEKMPSVRFSRIHRSFIINLSKIDKIEDSNVIITTESGSESIPIGKSFKEQLMNEINLISR